MVSEMMRHRSTSVKGLSAAEVEEQGVDVLFMVWLLARSSEDLLNTVLGPVGLTGDDLAIYSMLRSAGTITPTELARWMAAPPTTVSSCVKRLEARGHIVRETNPDDKRSYRIRLTPAGQRAHEAAAERFLPIRSQVEDALGEEHKNTRAALLRLRAVVDDVRGA
jgi:DNA-binding MarR family transcriptional regulator